MLLPGGDDERIVYERDNASGSYAPENGQILLESLSSVQSKLDVLLGWQDTIFSALHSRGEAISTNPTADYKEERVSADKCVSVVTPSPTEEDVDDSYERVVSTQFEVEDLPRAGGHKGRFAATHSTHQLKLRQYFVVEAEARSIKMKKTVSLKAGYSRELRPFPVYECEDDMHGRNRRSRSNALSRQFLDLFPLMPQSRIALSLDMVSVIFLFYDSIMVPFMLAWGTQVVGYFLWSSWITSFFWTMDMCLHFVKGFTHDNEVVCEYKRIACHYLKRRFILDFLVVSCDWLGIIFEMLQDTGDDSSNSLVFVRFVRLLKAGRLFRLHALMKTNRYVIIKEVLIRRAAMFGLDVQAVFLAILLKLVVVLLWLNHIASCAWIALETSTFVDQKGERTWQYIIADMHGGTSFDDTGLSGGFLYSLSYYWALTTMFSGGSFLVPMTATESVFGSLYVLFGFLVASSMISSMATNLMSGHQANYEKRYKLQKLNEFLCQRNIDPWLSSTISRQLRQRLRAHRRVVESDVPLLTSLSADLREKLWVQLWTPAFTRQPLWWTCVCLDNQFIVNVIGSAAGALNAEPGEVLFGADCEIERMFILLHGTMQYTLLAVRVWDGGRDTSDQTRNYGSVSMSCSMQFSFGSSHSVSEPEKTNVIAYQQICEMALWVKWETLGLMEAAEHAELLAIAVSDFESIIEASTTRVRNVLRAYARALVAYVESENPSGLTDLATADHDGIVPLMPEDARVSMSTPALRALILGGDLGQELHDEVLLGKCNLRQDGTGEIMRVARLVVMRLERADGCICVSLGDFGNETARVNVNLPGLKRTAMMHLGESMDQILDKCFAGNIPEISVHKVEVDVEVKPSVAYGMATKYVRTVCHARILSSDFWHGGVQEFSWAHGNAECFAKAICPDSEKMSMGHLGPGDFDERERAFAWMSASEFERLKDMGSDAENIVKGWMLQLKRTLLEVGDDETTVAAL